MQTCPPAFQVALKAARFATEAHPSSTRAWQIRLDLEAVALGCRPAATPTADEAVPQPNHHQQQQLFALVVQALKQVPAADALQLWQEGFSLAEQLASAGSDSQLGALQKLLVAAVTAASVKGPARGGLGAAAGLCMEVTWRVQGPAAARKLWQQLVLLPPAGGDMFRAMVRLEQSTGPVEQQQQLEQRVPRQLSKDAVKHVNAVYEAWASSYGSSDGELWVDWAMFAQQQGKAGAGKVYWRAVKALEEPEEFIAAYRQQVGVA